MDTVDGHPRGDGRMRLAATAYPVAAERHGISRVLVPASPLRNLFVFSPLENGYGQLLGSRADLLRLGALIRVAASSRHSAVHIPAPTGGYRVSDSSVFYALQQEPLALLVCRDDAGLAAHDWPTVHRRTHHGPRPGSPTHVTAPAPRSATERGAGTTRLGARRPVRASECAKTLVLIGPAKLLFQVGDVLTWAGEEVAGNRHIHRDGHAYLNDFSGLIVAASDSAGDRRFGRGRLEFAILGQDPIFHQARWQKLRRARARAQARTQSRHLA